MAQMQLVTQPIAHSYRCTELWLYNYVRLHYSTPTSSPTRADSTSQCRQIHSTLLLKPFTRVSILLKTPRGPAHSLDHHSQKPQRYISVCKNVVHGSENWGKQNTSDKLGFNLKKCLLDSVTAFLKNDLASRFSPIAYLAGLFPWPVMNSALFKTWL